MDLIIDMSLMVGLNIGITEAIKRFFVLNDVAGKRFVPVISLSIGIVMALFQFGVNFESVVFGAMVGLTSSGLFSGTKAITGK